VASEEPAERALLTEGDLVVTGRWVSSAGARYAIDDISSAVVVRQPPAMAGPIVMATVGTLCLFSMWGAGGRVGGLAGIGLILAAVAWWTQKRPAFVVMLQTKSGEVSVLESADETSSATAARVINQAVRKAPRA
jgi:hypothetical protein